MSQYSGQGVVTPEAVVLDFPLAGAGSRTAAMVIDIAIRAAVIGILTLAGVILENVAGPLPGWIGVVLLSLGVFGSVVCYPLLFEWLWDGRTPGKATLGLRVVTAEGAPIGFREAAIRAFIGLVEIIATTAIVGLVVMLASSRSQRAGDHAASTVVLRQRSAQTMPSAVAFQPPEGSEDFALSLDVSRLTTDDYAVVRSMLVRAASLQSSARHQLADDLGKEMAWRLNVRPPEGITAEGFLSCIAAAYQRRFNLAR